MQVLVIGSLGGELGRAARIAVARGAKLNQADDDAIALARLRADARVDLVLVELPHDQQARVARQGSFGKFQFSGREGRKS